MRSLRLSTRRQLRWAINASLRAAEKQPPLGKRVRREANEVAAGGGGGGGRAAKPKQWGDDEVEAAQSVRRDASNREAAHLSCTP